MSLTTQTDYKGTVRISQNGLDGDILQDYLDEKEPMYLKDLLGCDLYDLYVSYLKPHDWLGVEKRMAELFLTPP